MENGGLGDTIIGRIGDACLSADCCCSDIANFLFIIFYAIWFYLFFLCNLFIFKERQRQIQIQKKKPNCIKNNK
jgi:hypothetical protein